jgi:hypothetical protein
MKKMTVKLGMVALAVCMLMEWVLILGEWYWIEIGR